MNLVEITDRRIHLTGRLAVLEELAEEHWRALHTENPGTASISSENKPHRAKEPAIGSHAFTGSELRQMRRAARMSQSQHG